MFSLVVDVASTAPAKARRHPSTELLFEIDRSIAIGFEASPEDPETVRRLNAAVVVGIARRLAPPGAVVDVDELETEIFGGTIERPARSGPPGLFGGTFPGTALSAADIDVTASRLQVSAAHVWAVLLVETSGSGFDQRRRPRILYERHWFSRLTDERFDQDHAISNPARGGYDDGTQYERLSLAFDLAPQAALESCSWGLGQVMGFNHEKVGFSTVEDMVSAMLDGEGPQLMAMAAFVEAENIAAALREERWADFARVYNGPKFAENAYDVKLKGRFDESQSGNPLDLDLRRDQAYLRYLGMSPGPIDGRPGSKTRTAVERFQAEHADAGLQVTGERDDSTTAVLSQSVQALVASDVRDLI